MRRALVLLVLVERNSVALAVERGSVSGTGSAFVSNVLFDLVIRTWEVSHVFDSMGLCPFADMLGFVAEILGVELD